MDIFNRRQGVLISHQLRQVGDVPRERHEPLGVENLIAELIVWVAGRTVLVVWNNAGEESPYPVTGWAVFGVGAIRKLHDKRIDLTVDYAIVEVKSGYAELRHQGEAHASEVMLFRSRFSLFKGN
ncbi:hypothetical protein D3C85_1516790 [compost metagenome]